MNKIIVINDRVKINNFNDLFFDHESRKFIGKIGIVEKQNKSGLFTVKFENGEVYKFAKYNLDLVINN